MVKEMSKEKLFREKLSILNVEFVDFISSAIKDNPEYDLSPSIRDYLEHVKELDKIYAEQRPVLVVKRQLPKAKKLDNGLIEPAGQFNFAPKIQMPALKETTKTPILPTLPKFTVPVSTSSPSSQNRKRRQEPLDYDAMKSGKADEEDDTTKSNGGKEKNVGRLFGGTGSGSTAFSFKPLPTEEKKNESESEPSAKKDTTNSNSGLFGSNSTTSNPLFGGFTKPGASFSFKGFGSSEKAPEAEKKNENGVSKNTSGNNSLFGSALLGKVGEPNSLFGSASVGKVGESNSLFGLASVGKVGESNSLFGSASVGKVGEPVLVKTFSSQATPQTGEYTPIEPSFAFHTSTNALPATNNLSTSNSLFGSLLKPTANPTFSFQPLQSTPPKKSEDGEGENEDQPPPKFEAVKHDEPDAVFTTKCALHNFTDGQYKKAGTGFIYIKKSDKGPQLLIRAATTIGNVLVNTYINDSFKAEKKDNNRIQFSYPSTDGIKTHLAKVVDFKEAYDYFSGTKKP